VDDEAADEVTTVIPEGRVVDVVDPAVAGTGVVSGSPGNSSKVVTIAENSRLPQIFANVRCGRLATVANRRTGAIFQLLFKIMIFIHHIEQLLQNKISELKIIFVY